MIKRNVKNIFFILLCCNFTVVYCKVINQKKFVIGSRWAGLFSNFMGVLNQIPWCIRNNKVPVVYWDQNSVYFVPQGYNGSNNVWEYYFEQVSPLKYEPGDTIFAQYRAPDGSEIVGSIYNNKTQPTKQIRQSIYNNIIKPYIRINRMVQKKIENFFNENMKGKHTIGIHLRGTDKDTEISRVDPYKILDTAQKAAHANSQFFIATDEQNMIKIAQKTLKGKVIYYDAHRSTDGSPVHLRTKALIGEEVVIDAMLLARCDLLIHTCSNVSTCVLLFNPDIPNILLSNYD